MINAQQLYNDWCAYRSPNIYKFMKTRSTEEEKFLKEALRVQQETHLLFEDQMLDLEPIWNSPLYKALT